MHADTRTELDTCKANLIANSKSLVQQAFTVLVYSCADCGLLIVLLKSLIKITCSILSSFLIGGCMLKILQVECT